MRTTILTLNDWPFTVKQTADEVEEAMTQTGPFGLLKFDLTSGGGKLLVDVHAIVAVTEYPDE